MMDFENVLSRGNIFCCLLHFLRTLYFQKFVFLSVIDLKISFVLKHRKRKIKDKCKQYNLTEEEIKSGYRSVNIHQLVTMPPLSTNQLITMRPLSTDQLVTSPPLLTNQLVTSPPLSTNQLIIMQFMTANQRRPALAIFTNQINRKPI